MMISEIEKMFNQEVREKKRTGTGAFHKRGKGVRHGIGSVKYNYEMMNRKDKRQYTKSSEVRVFNMYDNILPRDEFTALPEDQQKNCLIEWRSRFDMKTIQKEMGIGNNTLYDFVKQFELPPAPRGRQKTKEINKKKGKSAVNQTVNVINSTPAPAPVEDLTSGVNYSLAGKYSVDEIQSKLEKIALLLEGEKNKFHIEVKISEV